MTIDINMGFFQFSYIINGWEGSFCSILTNHTIESFLTSRYFLWFFFVCSLLTLNMLGSFCGLYTLSRVPITRKLLDAFMITNSSEEPNEEKLIIWRQLFSTSTIFHNFIFLLLFQLQNSFSFLFLFLFNIFPFIIHWYPSIVVLRTQGSRSTKTKMR